MKKIFALLIACALLCALVGCAAESGNTSSTGDTSSKTTSAGTSSAASSSSEASSADATSSEDTSSEGGDEDVIPAFINQYISWKEGAITTTVRATDATSVRLTGVDTEHKYGSVTLFTPESETFDDADFSDSVLAVFEYDPVSFNYRKTAFYEKGADLSAVTLPDDGFIVAASTVQDVCANRLKSIPANQNVFPHGVHNANTDYSITRMENAPEIDGIFKEEEWAGHLIEEIDHENSNWSYEQFALDNYYSTAKYYVAYDDNYLYLCVVVSSPYHYCPITTDKASDMWQYECIQVKFSSESPAGAYIFENFDNVINNKAEKVDGVLHPYGFAANDQNETCFYEGGLHTTFSGQVGCRRYDESNTTVYEIAIPWDAYELTPEEGMQVGLTFSVNSSNEEDLDEKGKPRWKNYFYRNGGGVIGRNDWSKIPAVTLA